MCHIILLQQPIDVLVALAVSVLFQAMQFGSEEELFNIFKQHMNPALPGIQGDDLCRLLNTTPLIKNYYRSMTKQDNLGRKCYKIKLFGCDNLGLLSVTYIDCNNNHLDIYHFQTNDIKSFYFLIMQLSELIAINIPISIFNTLCVKWCCDDFVCGYLQSTGGWRFVR